MKDTYKCHSNGNVTLTNLKSLDVDGGINGATKSVNLANGTDVYEHGIPVSVPVPEVVVKNRNGTSLNGKGIDFDKKPGHEITAHDGKGQQDDTNQRGCCGKSQPQDEKQPIAIRDLFTFATGLDKLIMVIGTIGAILQGCVVPVNVAMMGQVINVFIGKNTTALNGTNPYEDVMDDVMPMIYTFLGLGVGSFFFSYVAMSCWLMASERQMFEMRKRYFNSIIRYDISWFDVHEGGEIGTYFSDDIAKIGEGIGDKMVLFIQWTSTGTAAYVMALTRDWRLTMALILFCPFIIFLFRGIIKIMQSLAIKESKAYAKAGAVAEQALRSIRTVQSFQGQGKETEKYKANLGVAVKLASRKGVLLGLSQSALWFVFFIMLSVMLWVGIYLHQEDGVNAGNILPVFMGILIGSMSFAQAFTGIETFANARGAATKVFALIFQQPEIDAMSEDGYKPECLEGNIHFKNVQFTYPARQDVQILKGIDLEVKKGQHVALVGPSGCGKSTVIQLVQRFYDPTDGQVTIDGHDVKDLNVKWLRENTGVVSQEPVLFDASIADNIRLGNLDATDKELEQASRDANAHDFIKLLPEGYGTMIGERGAQLSGGQKQRIAIARALVRNPKILLLDEATSALDHESEAIVQNALDKAEIGRTTITVAHRLSTVRHADKIIAISEGEVVEQGTHDELMAHQGLYYQLAKLQTQIEKDAELDIGDVEFVEEDEDEECTAENELLRVSFRRQASKQSAASFKSIDRDVQLVAVENKLRSSKIKSQRTQKQSKNEKESFEEEIKDVKMSHIIKYNASEWHLILFGCIGSILAGTVHPAFSLMISEFITIFDIEDRDEQWSKTHLLAGLVIGLAFFSAIIRMMQGYFFQRSGAILTARLRNLSFESIINQDIGFFDLPQSQVGILCTRLSSDASLVQGATGSKIGQVLESMSVLVCAIIIAFYFGWKLALVVLSFLPFMVLTGFVQGSVIARSSKREKGQLLQAGKICSEVIGSIRTVASLSREEYFSTKLNSLVHITKRTGMKTAHLFGLTYGVANCLLFFAYATSFYYGSILVRDGEMEFYAVFRVFAAVIFGGTSIGRNSSFGADYAKARLAASRIISLIDRKPKIDVRQTDGIKMSKFQGALSLVDTVFQYPTRPSVNVLDKINLTINPGEKVALVGSSGCGKSTTVQLLERFYDPASGSVLLDGTDLRQINLEWFRYQVGIVSQEPSLFDCSIAENICYGDNSRQILMNEIIQAAKAANIHNFISSLPQGYDSAVGDKGTQLSGGQKQRIAIARALVRNPKILLLDEATSALDTESEKIVQEALDRASEQRTCIIIAHRLSTIQNADKIAVLNKGRIVEIGSHTQLMAIKGAYYRLQKAQNRP